MKTNVVKKPVPVFTHEGGKAVKTTPEKELLRTVATCMLFENRFYEGGDSIANRIAELCEKVSLKTILDMAVMVRNDLKLRHAPLWMLVQAFKKSTTGQGPSKAEAMMKVINRPDEMGELISLYWKANKIQKLNGVAKAPLPAQMKKGLAKVFGKFGFYQLAKWNRDAEITLRDVLRLVHPKAVDEKQNRLWGDLIKGTLAAPDTWEVALSAGKDKKETWTRLLDEKKLGSMATIMNLRNMLKVGVDIKRIGSTLKEQAPHSKLLPFRYMTAVKYAPILAEEISEAMLLSLREGGKLPGKTLVLVDVSGSMNSPMSGKSETSLLDAACALAILMRELCEECEVFSFSHELKQVPSYRGLALAESIRTSQKHGGTYLANALRKIVFDKKFDRIVVVTDEQSADGNIPLKGHERGYIINVAPYTYGLSLEGGWARINGFSERVVDWICFEELGRLLVKEEEDYDR